MLEKYLLRKYFLPSERQTATEWLTALHTGYQQSALNCWIAALLYLVTLAVAAHQLWSNQQAAEQFKVHSNCVLTVLSVPLQSIWNALTKLFSSSFLPIYHLLLPLAHIQFYFLSYLTSRPLFIPSIVLISNADCY